MTSDAQAEGPGAPDGGPGARSGPRGSLRRAWPDHHRLTASELELLP